MTDSIKVKNLTDAQRALIDDIMHSEWRLVHGELLSEGRSFIVASPETLREVLADLKNLLENSDFEADVKAFSTKPLTLSQVSMIAANKRSGVKNTAEKIQKALLPAQPDQTPEKIQKVLPEPAQTPTCSGLGSLPEPERVAILKTFDLAYFKRQAQAEVFAEGVKALGHKYKVSALSHMSCGREPHLDFKSQAGPMFAVSFRADEVK